MFLNLLSDLSIPLITLYFLFGQAVPLLERPPQTSGRRERKTVERYVQQSREESKRGAHVLEEGSGEKLGECPVICHNIAVRTSALRRDVVSALSGANVIVCCVEKRAILSDNYPRAVAVEDGQ